MLFLAVGRFKRGTDDKRKPLQQAFSSHLEQRTLRIRLAGPLMRDDGGHAGVFLIVEANDRAAVEHLVSTSPYSEGGLYESIDITAFSIESGGLQ